MDYVWYEQVTTDAGIEQGDIIEECPIPILGSSVFDAVLVDETITDVSDPISVKKADVIILSQSCDITNDKIDSLIVCPIWPLLKLVEASTYYKSKEARESLRQGKEPAYHLINKFERREQPLPYSVVEFHRIYSLPKEYLKSVLRIKGSYLRLLPPYREHLSQAFARYFMRVGLPIDIDREDIRKITS
jgi:hypothetical protein